MSGLLRPLGSAGLSPSHHWQPWYKAQLGAHLLPPFLLPPSLPGPSYSICLFWQPESILKVPGGEWNQSCYALSMITRQSGLSTSKYQISFLRDPSVFRKTHSMSDTYLLTCGVLCTFFLGGGTFCSLNIPSSFLPYGHFPNCFSEKDVIQLQSSLRPFLFDKVHLLGSFLCKAFQKIATTSTSKPPPCDSLIYSSAVSWVSCMPGTVPGTQ